MHLLPPLPHPPRLLPIRHDLERQPAEVHRQAQHVRELHLRTGDAQRGSGNRVDGHDGHQTEGYPRGLHHEGDEKPLGVGLYLVEAGIPSVLEDASEEVGTHYISRFLLVIWFPA